MSKKEIINYFDEFAKSVELAKNATIKLNEYICNFTVENSEEKMKEIHKIENEADKNLHKLKNYLLKDFLPPIDREDILTISHRIDDLVDGVDEIAININILNIINIENDMSVLINLLEKAIEKVHEMIIIFKNLKKVENIKVKIIEVNKIEEQADRLYEGAIRRLYKDEKDTIKILKWTKIYEIIEHCFDVCEKISDGVEEVLMKG